MTKTVTLRDANQNFAKYVREAESGRELVITRRGAPVAKLVPAAAQRVLTPAQDSARVRMRARLRKGWALNLSTIDRSALHER